MTKVDVSVELDAEDMKPIHDLMTVKGLKLPDLFDEWADDFWAFSGFTFASEGGNRNQEWDPNSPGYAAKKRKHFGDLPLLELTGTLRKAMSEQGAPGGVFDVKALEMAIGTDLDYAEKHQLGTDEEQEIGEPFNMTVRGVPARPFMFFESDDHARWTQIAQEHFSNLVEALS